MKTEIKDLLKLQHFLKIVKHSDSDVIYTLKKPSLMLIKNIHLNWLKYIHAKTYKNIPVYLNESYEKLEPKRFLFGIIKQYSQSVNEQTIFEQSFINGHSSNLNKSNLKFSLIFPQQDAMQYFMKWQRYRKYWWSSISTTPSLFSINDIKYHNDSANVDIVARFPQGEHAVENVAINFKENEISSCLSCSMSLEKALYTLLMDGLNNHTKEEYLRLHRKIAPYKISFALNVNGADKKDTLKDLATLLHHKLQSKKISAWLPDFTLPHDSQIQDNLHLGVVYTAILGEDTLENGIFRLMNSSTMLGEQVHVADFHEYAATIFEK